MRIPARSRALTATIVAAAFLGGCHDLSQYCDWGGLHRAETASPQRAKSKSRKTVLARVAQPRTVEAGARIRQFCGQRHILFQTGRLRESAQEKARNDVLCSQS
jgi:hypothetical protein